MVKPFAVRCSPAELMALRVLLGSSRSGRSLTEHHQPIILQIIIQFMGVAFDNLDLAVQAALRPGCGGVVNVLRDVTLVMSMDCLAVKVPPRCFLHVRSSGIQRRIRFMIPLLAGPSVAEVGAFGLGEGARLRVENVSFEFSPGTCHLKGTWRVPCFIAVKLENHSSTVVDVSENLKGQGCTGCITVLKQSARSARGSYGSFDIFMKK